MGAIEERVVEKFEKEAKDNQRESWWLAYVMDQIEEEKSKGITIDVDVLYLKQKKEDIQFLMLLVIEVLFQI